MANIAVVSFDRFLHGDEKARLEVASHVYEAFSTVGWVYLKDTGINQERVDEMFSLVRFVVLVKAILVELRLVTG